MKDELINVFMDEHPMLSEATSRDKDIAFDAISSFLDWFTRGDIVTSTSMGLLVYNLNAQYPGTEVRFSTTGTIVRVITLLGDSPTWGVTTHGNENEYLSPYDGEDPCLPANLVYQTSASLEELVSKYDLSANAITLAQLAGKNAQAQFEHIRKMLVKLYRDEIVQSKDGKIRKVSADGFLHDVGMIPDFDHVQIVRTFKP